MQFQNDDQEFQLQDQIEERWERICAFHGVEGIVEFNVRGNDVVLRDENSFELCLSYESAIPYLEGRLHEQDVAADIEDVIDGMENELLYGDEDA